MQIIVDSFLSTYICKENQGSKASLLLTSLLPPCIAPSHPSTPLGMTWIGRCMRNHAFLFLRPAYLHAISNICFCVSATSLLSMMTPNMCSGAPKEQMATL